MSEPKRDTILSYIDSTRGIDAAIQSAESVLKNDLNIVEQTPNLSMQQLTQAQIEFIGQSPMLLKDARKVFETVNRSYETITANINLSTPVSQSEINSILGFMQKMGIFGIASANDMNEKNKSIEKNGCIAQINFCQIEKMLLQKDNEQLDKDIAELIKKLNERGGKDPNLIEQINEKTQVLADNKSKMSEIESKLNAAKDKLDKLSPKQQVDAKPMVVQSKYDAFSGSDQGGAPKQGSPEPSPKSALKEDTSYLKQNTSDNDIKKFSHR